MRYFFVFIFLLSGCCAAAQYPFEKKLSYPEQLPTQVVYDMLTDSKGYIWLGTDKGLYRFNGRTFVSIPFENTSSKAVSYLQVDADGKLWCMNFYNQVFYYQDDSLKQFIIDEKVVKGVATFANVVVGTNQVWFHSFSQVFEFDKNTRKLNRIIEVPLKFDRITSSVFFQNNYYAFTQNGQLYSLEGKNKNWSKTNLKYTDFRFIRNNETLIGIDIGAERSVPVEFRNGSYQLLPEIQLPQDVYIFTAVAIDKDEYWLCTQSGAYKWDKKTGETRCYIPNARVTDVVKDYQGNYWFSTLDNGIIVCTSLYNTFLKIYNDPLLDNYTKLQALPDGNILAGNSQGLMVKINLDNNEHFEYDLTRRRETEFIMYDSVSKLIISNRGVFKPSDKTPVELLDLSKGVIRDRFGNLIIAVFSGTYLMNDHFGSFSRAPVINCLLYDRFKNDTVDYEARHAAILIRQKRTVSILGNASNDAFWVGYEDGLYEYHYNGTIRILEDAENKPVVARSLGELLNGDLVVGSSTKGVIIFRNGKINKIYTEKDGLSSMNVRKVLREDNDIWVLTDQGLDRIDVLKGTITNYLEEYGLSNTIINDFIISRGKLLFATPTGILVRHNVHHFSSFEIKFPLLKASSNGLDQPDKSTLPGTDIVFYFEALHYISANALSYQYRLKGIDTIWRPVTTLSNQLAFNRLAPGSYQFEIMATAGSHYQSAVRRFSFTVAKPFWQTPVFFIGVFLLLMLFIWMVIQQWKTALIKRQTVKEQLLKSQLVALRAQMNPHFLYNVLNTVQGLVYGNRKTEAGELLGNFSDLMRKTLQASDKQLLPLNDEIENIRLYLELEKARFDEGFDYSISLINIEDQSSIFIPSLLLQPFVENSVKHGLMHKPGNKELLICFENLSGKLLVTIDDNGIGRAQSMEINKRSKSKPYSFATAAITERIELFNRLYKQKIWLTIVDKTDNRGQPEGTKIELHIPVYAPDPQSL